MKFLFLTLCVCFNLALSSGTNAATILVSGVVEGSAQRPGHGETMDYLKFEVLATTTIRVSATGIGSLQLLLLAAYIGVNDEFGFIGDAGPWRLSGSTVLPAAYFDRILDPGTYVLALSSLVDSQYDIFDGFVPVNVDGGFGADSPYNFEVAGENIQGLEFWEGQLDPQPYGSFKITTIPEPGTASLIGGSALLLFQRNAHTRKENKALQQTARGLVVSALHLIRKCLSFGLARSRP